MSREDIATEGKMTLTYLLVSQVKRTINYTLQQLHQVPKMEKLPNKDVPFFVKFMCVFLLFLLC